MRAANIYFDGKVTSRTIKLEDGEMKTLGIMLPGEYTFGTEAKELMEFVAGELDVKFAGSENWETFVAPCHFYVDANSSFDLKIKSVADYCCSYLKD